MAEIICNKCEAVFVVEEFWGDPEEVLCPDCLQNQAEAAYERHCEDFHDGGSTAPWPDTERKRQEEARKLK